MKPYLIFLGLGSSGAGIVSLISYGAKATDSQDYLNDSIEYKNGDSEFELEKIRKEEERQKLEEQKRRQEEEERKRLEAEERRKKLETMKDKIERLMKEIKNIFKKHFLISEDKSFLNNLKDAWSDWLDNVDILESELKLKEKKQEIFDILKNFNKDQKFDEMCKKMEELLKLWKDLSNETHDYNELFGKFHRLFNNQLS